MSELSADVLRRLRDGAAERDRERRLPRAEIRELLDAGFGASRVPSASGGEGVDLATLFARLIDLATADSNVAHVFRGHLAVIEMQFFEADAARRAAWYARALAGDLVGNAQSEQTATSDLATTLTDVDGELRLNGRKYYTTGSIYADWIDLSARHRGEDHQVIVSTRTPGVQSIDDWAGFGQRLTGSGTTTFTDVVVDPELVRPYALDDDGFRHPYLMGFFQLVLLSVVAGIGRAAVDDAVAFVQPRRRIFGYGGEAFPREDPLVQSVVGRLSSAAFTARAAVLEAARSLDAALDGYRAGTPDPAAFTRAQLDVYRAQQTVLPSVIAATGELFEVGGASSVDVGRGLDRHWRNARTIATHNPSVQRLRALGDWELNGVVPLFNQPQNPTHPTSATPATSGAAS
ncbi:acyl-CoA dehydrogenase family protein [Microbacterium sp. 1.5R]|uniref:acyl-CoA dehydrogenase family protein n=1 Tax=Microbacterium sp. 1.5R TaxID=1916917 RepID=UPI00119D5286|nr:acyl-CoA dehydrogenase family protein [Microbacterium sp. 1.5R]